MLPHNHENRYNLFQGSTGQQLNCPPRPKYFNTLSKVEFHSIPLRCAGPSMTYMIEAGFYEVPQ